MPIDDGKLTRRDFGRNAAMAAAGMGLSLGTQAWGQETAGMKITVIGDSSCIPDVGRETACFLIDGKHLVDSGWCAALGIASMGSIR